MRKALLSLQSLMSLPDMLLRDHLLMKGEQGGLAELAKASRRRKRSRPSNEGPSPEEQTFEIPDTLDETLAQMYNDSQVRQPRNFVLTRPCTHTCSSILTIATHNFSLRYAQWSSFTMTDDRAQRLPQTRRADCDSRSSRNRKDNNHHGNSICHSKRSSMSRA